MVTVVYETEDGLVESAEMELNGFSIRNHWVTVKTGSGETLIPRDRVYRIEGVPVDD